MGRDLIGNRRVPLGVTLAILAAAILLGCGGSAGGDSTSADKGAFVKQANAICTRGKSDGLQRMSAYARAHTDSGQSRSAQLAKALQKVFLPEVDRQAKEIRALGPPQGDEEQVEAFLAALEEAVDVASRKGATAPNFAAAFKRSAQLAREYGLDACAYG
jgi:hypothetical protein